MSPKKTLHKSIPISEPWILPSYADVVRNQILSGWIGPGSATSAFQEAISAYVGSAHCLLTTSGTLALTVAAHALGLKPGAEILVPAYGVISTINAFASYGFHPRLVDIDRSTGCMSPEELKARIGPKTKAVCFVNFSGYTGSNLVEVMEICRSKGVFLIEDAACAFGHRFEGRFAGTFGHIGTYSFSVPKIITTGQGGALVTASAGYHERAAAFIDQGDLHWRQTNLVREIGTNLRFNDILASFGMVQLTDIERRLECKRKAYEILRSKLGRGLFQVPGENAPLHHIVFTREADKLMKALREQGISAIQLYRTICQHPAYGHLAEDRFPQADDWTAHAVYLPFGLSLGPEEATRIGETVLQAGVSLEEFC